MIELIKRYDVETPEYAYPNVKPIFRGGAVLSFEKTSDCGTFLQYYEISGPYTLIEITRLSCGHKLDSYYEEDGGNAGVFTHCKECDVSKESVGL